MPISISLPAPNIEWTSKYFSPLIGASGIFVGNHGVGVVGPLSVVAAMNYTGIRPSQGRDSWLSSGAGGPTQALHGFGAVGAGTNPRWALRLGRTCMWDKATNNAVSGELMVPYDWLPDLGGAADVPVGAVQDDASIVGVFDFHISAALAGAPPWADGAVGFYFLPFFPDASATVPSGGGINCRQVPGATTGTPGDPDDVGGFGVFLNTSGATTVLEYMSWATGSPGASLERVVVPIGIAPNVTNWNSVRFVIVGARPGFAAQMSMFCNGQVVVPVRTFGSAQLADPGVSAIGAAGLAIGFNIAGAGGVFPDVFTQWHMKFGRFTPDGAELQAP